MSFLQNFWGKSFGARNRLSACHRLMKRAQSVIKREINLPGFKTWNEEAWK